MAREGGGDLGGLGVMVVSRRARRGTFRREWSAVSDAATRPSECKERKASFGLGNGGR